MFHLSRLLAFQSSADKSSRLFGEVLPYLIALIAVVVVGGVIMYLVRRRLRADDGGKSDGFTLQDLRDLHASGELTDAEFERAKAQMIGRLKAPSKPEASGPPPGNVNA